MFKSGAITKTNLKLLIKDIACSTDSKNACVAIAVLVRNNEYLKSAGIPQSKEENTDNIILHVINAHVVPPTGYPPKNLSMIGRTHRVGKFKSEGHSNKGYNRKISWLQSSCPYL